MIGQKKLISFIDDMIAHENFPRFVIIEGARGSGKSVICTYIARHLGTIQYIVPDNKVETIRNAIADAYKIVSPTCYVFSDVDNMSINAKNALLKVTEEPPNNAYFIMTAVNRANILPTMISRASTLFMMPYSKEELDTYYHDYATDRRADVREVINKICETPGEIQRLVDNGAVELYKFAEKVIDNVVTVSGANAFKIADSIAFKDEVDKFDFELFMRAFRSICTERLLEDTCKYGEGVRIASECLNQMQITGINKKALFDIFILDIRKAWG